MLIEINRGKEYVTTRHHITSVVKEALLNKPRTTK
jgi:peptidyl-tRNA hydrolase